MNLESWFLKKTRRPLLIAAVVVLTLITLLLTQNLRQRQESLQIGTRQAAELIGLGLSQKNRPLIESSLSATRWQLGTTAAALCRGEISEVDSGSGSPLCSNVMGLTSQASLTQQQLRAPVPGFSDYSIVITAPRVPNAPLLAGILLLTAGLIGFFLYLLDKVQKDIRGDLLLPLKAGVQSETPLEIDELEALRKLHKDATQSQIQSAVADAVLKENQQIAHDIRSPLAALGMLLSSPDCQKTLAPEDRQLMKSAVNRIRDISNLLSSPDSTARNTAEVSNDPTPSRSVELLASLLDPIISEKRLEFRSRLGVEIESQAHSHDISAKVDPVELKRVISNLVNNAVESIDGKGSVIVTLARASENTAEISITDTGKGIPPEVLAQLTERGATFGKSGGSGLGLFHARQTIESWQGSLQIESQLGVGTTVKIRLPLSRPPSWFLEKLTIAPGSTVAILDDDNSIHHVWRDRFKKAGLSDGPSAVKLMHLSTPQELRAAIKTFPDFFLVDYELLGFKETGLDLIRELGIASNSCLVTSHIDEKAILERCERIGLRAIPKSLAASVPIVGTPTESTS